MLFIHLPNEPMVGTRCGRTAKKGKNEPLRSPDPRALLSEFAFREMAHTGAPVSEMCAAPPVQLSGAFR